MLPWHTLEPDLREVPRQSLHLGCKDRQVLFSDAVLTRELTHDQFRIRPDLEPLPGERPGGLKTLDDGVVLGRVVGRRSDVPRNYCRRRILPARSRMPRQRLQDFRATRHRYTPSLYRLPSLLSPPALTREHHLSLLVIRSLKGYWYRFCGDVQNR